MSTSRPELFLDSAAQLEQAIQTLASATAFAFDTEFVRESTYFARLCLIQVASDKLLVCVDCLAEMETTALWSLLLGADRTIVAHSVRQDLELIWQTTDRRPGRLHDTQIAAGLLGYAPQVGLQELLERALGVSIGKTLTRTDWSRRPLAGAEIDYAAADVRHLLALDEHLREALERSSRLAWFDEDCARALQVELEPGMAGLFERLKGRGRLDAGQTAAALALLEWREARARAANRPRRWILADEVIVAVARQRPTSPQALAAVEGVSSRMVERHGRRMIEVLAGTDAYCEMAQQCMPAERPPAERVKALQSQVREQAKVLGIEPEILASRRDIVAVIQGATPDHLATGWRAEVLRLGN